MALPPTIPTSFVPHSAMAGRQFRSDYSGAFGFFAYTVVAVMFLLALGIFFYGRVLSIDKAAKEKSIAEAQQQIEAKTVEGFVRLRDRLVSSQALLDTHVAFTGFFSTLAKIMPTTVRFSTLHLSFDVSNMPKVEGSGVAKSFNALAAASQAFATDGRIKSAIFSHLNVNKDNSVSFVLSATLDPSLVAFTP